MDKAQENNINKLSFLSYLQQGDFNYLVEDFVLVVIG